MTSIAQLVPQRERIEARAAELYERQLRDVYLSRDRIFVVLMSVQWLMGVVMALTLSPRTWAGAVPSLHPHVPLAVLGGGLLSGTTIALARLRPGSALTRQWAAVAQMLWSALIIHLSGGRVEAHFHIFGSLAFLAFYRDVSLVAIGTAVVVLDHLIRGIFYPESVYGVAHPEWWRFGVHVSWVLFEDVVLVWSIVQGRREMRLVAHGQAELEEVNTRVEDTVLQRTLELETSRQQFKSLVENSRAMPLTCRVKDGQVVYAAPQCEQLLGLPVEEWLKPTFWRERMYPEDYARMVNAWAEAFQEKRALDMEYRLKKADGNWIWVRSISNFDSLQGKTVHSVMLDITEKRDLEAELAQSQKLESVGRLAAGIAHELNTPIQFVGDSIHFVQESFNSLIPLIARYRQLLGAQNMADELRAELAQAEETADLEYTVENVPQALASSVDGLQRVASIVRSMKEFAHPDQRQKAGADLNHALTTTLTIARNEYKYVADVETDFGDIPSVLCHVNELNQAFLNIIVNASHAIADRVKGTHTKGKISIKTVVEGDDVLVSITDTGGGIPEDVLPKIFDPFFTTKEVGKGTGQGLAIVRTVVVKKHGGRIGLETQLGQGTTFHLRIPIRPPDSQVAAAAA